MSACCVCTRYIKAADTKVDYRHKKAHALCAQWDARIRDLEHREKLSVAAYEHHNAKPSIQELLEDVMDQEQAAQMIEVFPTTVIFDRWNGYDHETRSWAASFKGGYSLIGSVSRRRAKTYLKHPPKQAKRCKDPGCDEVEGVHGNAEYCTAHRTPAAKQQRYRDRKAQRA